MNAGMNVAGFAQQQIQAERKGKDELFADNMAKNKAQLSAYEILENSIKQMTSDLKELNEGAFNHKTSSISDDHASITVESNAPTGGYDLVVKQLAQAHQVSTSFASEEARLPTSGMLTIQVGSSSNDTLTLNMAEINPSGTATLAELRDKINKHPDNPGVQASLVRTGDTVELMFSAKETGANSSITIAMQNANSNPDGDWKMIERRAAQDARVTLNGIEINNSSNSLNNLVDGVSIELNKVHKDSDTSRINIKKDTKETKNAVTDFVDTFNNLMDEINQLTRSMGSAELDKINKDKEARNKDKNDDDDDDDDKKKTRTSSITEQNLGALKGDSSIRMLQQRMRDSIFNPAANGMYLSDIGIETSRDGRLQVNKEKLSQKLKDDPAAVQAMFTGNDILIDKMNNIVKPYTQSSGLLDLKQEHLTERQSRIEKDMSVHNDRMKQKHKSILASFVAMEGIINQLSAAMSYFI